MLRLAGGRSAASVTPGRGWLAVCSGYSYVATRHFDATFGHLANDVYSGRLTAHNNRTHVAEFARLRPHLNPIRRIRQRDLKGLIVQTQLPLHSIAPVVYGYHENPFEVLGPHEVEQNGRRALAVRAYLPEAQRAWVVDPAHGVTRPMRRIHPAGLYEAVVEEHGATATNRHPQSPVPQPPATNFA